MFTTFLTFWPLIWSKSFYVTQTNSFWPFKIIFFYSCAKKLYIMKKKSKMPEIFFHTFFFKFRPLKLHLTFYVTLTRSLKLIKLLLLNVHIQKIIILIKKKIWIVPDFASHSFNPFCVKGKYSHMKLFRFFSYFLKVSFLLCYNSKNEPKAKTKKKIIWRWKRCFCKKTTRFFMFTQLFFLHILTFNLILNLLCYLN